MAVKVTGVRISGTFVFVVKLLPDPEFAALCSFVGFTISNGPVTTVEFKKVSPPFSHSVQNGAFFCLFEASENGGVLREVVAYTDGHPIK